MKAKYWLIVLALIVILGMVLFVLNDYKLNINETEVVCVSFYNESRIMKKVVTDIEDIRNIIKAINSLHSWGKYDFDDLPTGGMVYYLAFECGNATRLIIYNQTDHDGHGFLRDDNVLIKVSGLNLKDVWNSLEYEEIEAKPSLELFSD